MELTLLEKSDIEAGWNLARPTDLALLSNVYVCGESVYGEFWTKTIIDNRYFYCMRFESLEDYRTKSTSNPNYLYAGVRPVLQFDKTSFSTFIGKQEVTYGEYPQTVVSWGKQKEIDEVFKTLPLTGKGYTLCFNDENGFVQHNFKKYPEFVYKNKKYIDFQTAPCYDAGVLSNSRTWLDLDYIIEVEPISWLVDEDNYRLISKCILLGGIPMKPIIDEIETTFKNTRMYAYLSGVLSNEINPSAYSSRILDEDKCLHDYFLGDKRRQLIKGKK